MTENNGYKRKDGQSQNSIPSSLKRRHNNESIQSILSIKCRKFKDSEKFCHVSACRYYAGCHSLILFHKSINPLPDDKFKTLLNREFPDDNFKFDENGRKLSKQVEKTGGKGEIAHYEQFLLFPQCFQ